MRCPKSLCNPNGTFCMRRAFGGLYLAFSLLAVVMDWHHELLEWIIVGGFALIGLTTADIFAAKKILTGQALTDKEDKNE